MGICGYLPFANHIESIAKGSSSTNDDDPFCQDSDDDEDPFPHSGDENDEDDIFDKRDSASLPLQAVTFLREEIDMEDKSGMIFRDVPVFLGHGTEDEKVDIELGREVKTCLNLIGADVEMVEYDGLGHWYSEEMLKDIFAFLKDKLRVGNP